MEVNNSVKEFSRLSLMGIDALGRKVTPVSESRDKKYVGVFYFLWLGQHPTIQTDIRDIQKLLNMGEEGKKKLEDLSDGGQFYFWGEPLYGYYNMADPWILVRHLELLYNAGLDFICFDTTNCFGYTEVIDKLLAMMLEYTKQGYNLPKVCFYTNTGASTNPQLIYEYFYQPGKWDSLWFAPNGKPIIMGITENSNNASDYTFYKINDEVMPRHLHDYFEVKESQWPLGEYNPNGVPWMSWEYPQRIHSGYIAVPVSQHAHSTVDCSYSLMQPTSHRGYNNITKKVEGDYREGLSFQQMWDSAHQRRDEIHTVFVTGFNEWIAQKNRKNGSFCDGYNAAYSRDIDLMRGYYEDNYYMQLMENVRKFKWNPAIKGEYPVTQIDMTATDLEGQFANVKAHYVDFKGDAMPRDYINMAGTFKYQDNSNRNDITDIKVAQDGVNMYFMVKTADAITEYNGTDTNWMNILIGDGNYVDTFAGYRYIINRNINGNRGSVEKYVNGAWQQVGEVQFKVNGNVMVVCVPLDMIGKSKDDLLIQFKVADNVTNQNDIMDYYITGDTAPLGRVGFGYGY